MKILVLSVTAILLAAGRLFSQGDLVPPPGPPAPAMKSLQEIWDKIDALETRATALETQNTLLQSANSQLVRQLGLLAASTVNFAWVVSTVAQGSSPSLAFSPNGQPAIAFVTPGPQIRLAQFDGTTWILEDVPGAQGSEPSLAFGLDGYPAIAYSGPSARLHFARFDGTSWSVTMVDATGQAGYTPSLAFGPDGLPGIASSHIFGATNSLKYAAFTGSEWSFITVATGDVDYSPSLAFGPNGQPAISFRVKPSGNTGLVALARLNAGVWSATTAANDQTFASSLPTSLAFGPDGQPAIAFRNEASQRLYVTRYSGSVWTPVTVTVGNTYSKLSLAFGLDGQPALAYFTSGGGDLLLGRYTGSLDGPAWVSTVADSAGELYDLSLAFGPDGQPAIAYWDYASNTAYIKFARKGVFKPLP